MAAPRAAAALAPCPAPSGAPADGPAWRASRCPASARRAPSTSGPRSPATPRCSTCGRRGARRAAPSCPPWPSTRPAPARCPCSASTSATTRAPALALLRELRVRLPSVTDPDGALTARCGAARPAALLRRARRRQRGPGRPAGAVHRRRRGGRGRGPSLLAPSRTFAGSDHRKRRSRGDHRSTGRSATSGSIVTACRRSAAVPRYGRPTSTESTRRSTGRARRLRRS